MRDLTMNCDIATVLQIMDTWNVEDVILHQGKIRGSTVHDRPDIYGNNFTRQIFTLPIEDGTIQESVTGQTLSLID